MLVRILVLSILSLAVGGCVALVARGPFPDPAPAVRASAADPRTCATAPRPGGQPQTICEQRGP